MASLYQSSSRGGVWHLPCIRFRGRSDRTADLDRRKGTSARRVTSACEASTCCFFVHGDAIATEMTPPFRPRKGRRSDPYKKPRVGHWFHRNRFPLPALFTSYLLPVFGQFRDIPSQSRANNVPNEPFCQSQRPRHPDRIHRRSRSPPCDGGRRPQDDVRGPAAAGRAGADRRAGRGPPGPCGAHQTAAGRTLPVRWKIDGRHKRDCEGETQGRPIDWPGDLPHRRLPACGSPTRPARSSRCR